MKDTPEIPKFYGPLAEKLLRAYLALPEKSPLRTRFERLMVAEDAGEQMVQTPDTASGKFDAMGGEDDSMDGGGCESCGCQDDSCDCSDGEDDPSMEQAAPTLVMVTAEKQPAKKGMPLSGKRKFA
jgi:hypothetical protein